MAMPRDPAFVEVAPPPARWAAQNPSEDQAALMRDLDRASDSTTAANELEVARRVAPLDLWLGVPE